MAMIPYERFPAVQREDFETVCRKHGRDPADFIVTAEEHYGGHGWTTPIIRIVIVRANEVVEEFDDPGWTARFERHIHFFPQSARAWTPRSRV
jgi:hypothetical protein